MNLNDLSLGDVILVQETGKYASTTLEEFEVVRFSETAIKVKVLHYSRENEENYRWYKLEDFDEEYKIVELLK